MNITAAFERWLREKGLNPERLTLGELRTHQDEYRARGDYGNWSTEKLQSYVEIKTKTIAASERFVERARPRLAAAKAEVQRRRIGKIA